MNVIPDTHHATASLDGARLTALLGRARRRLGLARLLQTLSLCVPLVAAALVAASWLMGHLGWSIAAAGLLATMAAGLLAWFGTPRAAGLAALLDQRLKLADRLGTALRVATRTDAVALLIQHDAVAHVTPSGIDGALPLRVHRGTWLACAVVAVFGSLWLVDRPALEVDASDRVSGGGLIVRTPGGGASNAAARGPATSSDRDRAPGRPSSVAGSTPEATITRASRESEGTREGATGVNTPTPSGSVDRATSGRGAGTPASASRSNRADAASGDGAAGRGATPIGGSGDARAAAGRGATQAATGGAGAAGGVQFGRTVDTSGTAARDGAAPAPSAAAIRQGQLRADTAIAHDDVPPRYRAYLRDYFRAVQAMSQP